MLEAVTRLALAGLLAVLCISWSALGQDTQRVEIPVINFAAFADDSKQATAAEMLEVANKIKDACEKVGFFILEGHGVEGDLISDVWNSTMDYFDSPLDHKMETVRPQHEYPFGYSRLGGEILKSGKQKDVRGHLSDNSTTMPDLKEMFSLGPSNPAAGFGPRLWPRIPDHFEDRWSTYYETMASLAGKIMRAFAMALQLDQDDYFERFVDHHASALRALNYPDMENHPLVPGQLRASAHTDYGTITILKTDAAGLQVSKDTDSPDWVDVPYVPSGYIINLGDLMARWTNDKWVSTLHRVVNPAEVAADDCLAGSAGNGTCAAAQSPDSFKKTRRQSIAFFYNVNPDAVIESLPSRYVEDGPGKYPAVVAGDFLLMKHLAANPHLAEEEAESQA